jgi:hypothetical protein
MDELECLRERVFGLDLEGGFDVRQTGVGKSGEAPPEFEVAHAHQILALGAERGTCCRHPPPREACQRMISR